MTADERALLLAIHAAPADDLPRRVYADFLDDAGFAHRANFLRLQCDWHRALTDPAHEAYRIPLYNRLQDEGWAHGDPGPPDADGAVGWAAFRRGLPAEATVLAHELTGPLADVFVLAPLRRAEVRDATAGQLDGLLDLPREVTAGLRELVLVRPNLTGILYGRLRERFGDVLQVTTV